MRKMGCKKRFKELGYKLHKDYLDNIDLIENGTFSIMIYYDKKKIVVDNTDEDSLCAISKELLEILMDYLEERDFFLEEEFKW